MSSSGVIYAIIVGAWAVYLVPMWLRREDELNRVRETQRYAAAIKVLAHKEAFERRWARPGEAGTQEALPLAAGQGFVPGDRVVKRTALAGPGAKVGAGAADPWAPGPANQRGGSSERKSAKRTAAAASATKPTVTASVADEAPRAAKAKVAPEAAPRAAAAKYPGPRTGLMARRRRVVGGLFTLSTLGALVSADLGAGYLWVMAVPALLLSTYIVRLRRDERIRAAAKARRRAAAQLAREVREAREAELQARDEKRAQAAHALAEAHAQAEAESQALTAQQRRAETARRRSSAAGRARAQAYVQETPELPRASNG